MTIKEKIRELSRKHQGTMTDANYLQMLYALEEMAEFLKKDKEAIVNLIPELKESEDERIRKGIIQYLEQSQFGEEPYQIDDDVVRNYIAWLEKQGKYKESPCDRCKREQPSHSCQDITELGRCYIEKQGEQKESIKNYRRA